MIRGNNIQKGVRRPVAGATVLIPGDGTTNWEDVLGMTATLGKIVPSSGGAGWGGKSGSFGLVPANKDFTLEWNPINRTGGVTGYFMVGMSNIKGNDFFHSIQHGFYTVHAPPSYPYSLDVFESGVKVLDLAYNEWTPSTLFEIKRVSGAITYYVDGVLKYTSSVVNNAALYFDCAAYQDLGAENISITIH